MQHWTEEFYRRVDAFDPHTDVFFAENIYIECANFPPTRGKAAAALPSSAFPRIVAALSGVAHDTLARWEISPDEVIYRFRVNYKRLDGRVVSLPAITTLHRDTAGLIDDLRLYIELRPLFAGLAARIVNGGSSLISAAGHAEPGRREALWEVLTRDAVAGFRFAADAGDCRLLDEGTDEHGRRFILREIAIDRASVRERLTFEPDQRLTITRIGAEQHGEIHLGLETAADGIRFSVRFDLIWDGVAEGGFLVPLLEAQLRDHYLQDAATRLGPAIQPQEVVGAGLEAAAS